MRTTTDAMSLADVARLMMSLPDNRARAIVSLDVYEGLRTGEIARLHVGDYDRGSLLVVAENGTRRAVVLGDAGQRCLEAWLRERDDEPGGIFPGATTWSISDEIVGWVQAAPERRPAPPARRSRRSGRPGT